MSFICSQCGSSNIDNDPARGNPACIDCGTVVATELIISEVEFEEVAGGRHKAVGQFVGKGEIGATSLGGLHHGNKRSREITLYNAKRHISAMANALSMPSHLVDMAHNFYKLSLDQGLTRGRKLTHIVASCLYIVARLEGTPHMLLDFCDLAQANVVVVCKCYMCITMALCIHLPPTDPSLYIPRFAEKLGFGEKSHQVAMTALRIAQRMKRDWMVLGRRPAGLCGAALLFAARIHGFNRTIENIAATVKLSRSTIRSRILEFEETYAAALTVEEFTEKDEDLLLPECDPPAYKRSQCIDSLLEQELKNLNPDNFERDICLLEKQIEHEIQKLCQKSTSKTNFKALSRFTQEVFCDDIPFNEDVSVEDFIANMNAKLIEKYAFESKDPCEKNSWTYLLKDSISISDKNEEILEPTPDTDNIEVLVFTEDEDKEIDEYILSKDETMRKAKIWLKANADWLKGQRLKEIRKREEQEDRDANPHYKERKLKKRTQKSVEPIEANSISEALTAIIKEKKLTTKLNTDLLKSIDDVFPTIEKTSTDIDENQKLNLNLSDAIVVEDSEMHVAEQPHDEDIKDDDIDEDEEEEDEEDDDLLKGFRGNIGDAETDDEY